MKSKTLINEKYEGYCVYGHFNVSDSKLFYIGKGKGNRPWVKASSMRSKKWVNHVKKHGGHTVKIIQANLSESEAFEIECKEIALAIKNGIALVNQTTGGEGFSGGAHTKKTIKTIRNYHLLNSEAQGNNPRRGVIYSLKEKKYVANITLTINKKRKQYSLGRYANLEDAIRIRSDAENSYIEGGIKSLEKFINEFRDHYDTHSTRKRQVIIVLKDKKLWFNGITEAASALGNNTLLVRVEIICALILVVKSITIKIGSKSFFIFDSLIKVCFCNDKNYLFISD